MPLSAHTEDRLERDSLVDALQESLNGGLVALALYGSRARGDARSNSDWDLFVLARDLPADKHERGRQLSQGLCKRRIAGVSLLALSTEEFEKDLHPIFIDIAWDAVILYDRDGYLKRKIQEIKAIAEEKGLSRVMRHGEWVWDWKVWPKPGTWELSWRR